ncbi:MAG: hypothetical protein J1E34_05165 [Oscillospiraceae bacterium]|nr:hypothetical protein [Oscillospiraceae bacterium]
MTHNLMLRKIVSILMTVIMTIIIFIPAASALNVSSKEYYTVEEPYFYDNAVSNIASISIVDKIDLEKLRSEVFEFFYNCPAGKDENGNANPTAFLDVSKYQIPVDERSAIFSLIWHEWAELFHIKSISYYRSSDDLVTKIGVTEYYYEADEYHRMLNVCEREAEKLLKGIKGNKSLTDLEKVLLIHDRIAASIEYDYDDYLAKTLDRSVYNMYGVLGNKTAVCEGYSLANIYLLEKVGIKAVYCSSGTLSHAWNIVYINGRPYHVDVTHDDPVWDVTGRVNHKNLLLSTNALYNDTGSHTATDYNTTPTDTTYDHYFWQDSNTEFQLLNGDIYYINNSDAKIYRVDGNTKTAIASIEDKWRATATSSYAENYSRLSSDGTYLLYSLSNAVYKLDVKTGKSTILWQPEKPGEFYNIYGFTYDGTYLICDINSKPNSDATTKANYQQKKLYDVTPPTAVMTASNQVATSQTVTIDLYDEGELSGYYWGTSANYNQNNYTAIAGSLTETQVSKTVTQSGTYYLTAADKSGNLSETFSITFVKTTLDANPGSVSPSYVITASGNSFPLPKAERVYFENLGWSVDQTKTVSYKAGDLYQPNASKTLYAVWSECTHGTYSQTVIKEATCYAEGEMKYTCTICGEYSYTEMINKTPHTVVIDEAVAATCTKTGLSEGKHCSVCNEVIIKQEVTEKLPHNYIAATVKPDALKSTAGCETPAVYYYSCSVCGDVEHNDAHTFTNGEANGHSFVWVTDKEATCGATGIKHEVCSDCGVKRSENTEIPATGNHSYTAQIVNDKALKSKATCEKAASYYYSCANCGTLEKNDDHTFTFGNTTDHEYEWSIDEDATCTSTGIKHEKCVHCGATRNENTLIDRKDHTLSKTGKKDADCTTVGNTEYYTCNVCKKIFKDSAAEQEITADETIISPKGHIAQVIAAKAPSCTDAGNIEYYSCANCRKNFKDASFSEEISAGQVTLSATGHNYQQTKVSDPTCQSEGYITYVCSNDASHNYTEKLPKVNHKDSNGDGKCDMCDTEMSNNNAKVCKYCGEVHTGFFGWIVKFFHFIFSLFNK